ncbi:unnamed protein product [Closterium sp. NIES-53]
MASLRVLLFNHEGRPFQFDTWLDDLQLYLLRDCKDSVSLFDLAHNTGYSSPATAALGQLLLPYLFPELSAFATVDDLSLASLTLFALFLSLDPTSLTIDLLEQHLLAAETSAVAVGAARGTPRPPFFEGCSPSPLAPSYASAAAGDVSVAEDVGAASTSAKHRSSKGKGGRGGGGGSGGGGGGSGSGGGGSSGVSGGSGGGGGGGTGGGSGGPGGGGGGSGGGSSGSGSTGGGGPGGSRTGPQHGGPSGGQRQQQQRRSETQSPQQLREWLFQRGTSGGSDSCPYVIRTGVRAGQTCEKLHTQHRCFSRLDDAWRAEFGDDVELPRWANLLSAKGDSYQCVPPDPAIAAAALGAREPGALPGTAPAEALHTFTLDSGALHCFFRDSTTLTPLPAPVPVSLADPSGSLIVARSSTVLPCPAVPSGSLSGLHLPSFSTNLVSTAAPQDAMVTTTTRGGSSLFTLATEPPQVVASARPRQCAAPHSSSFPPTSAPLQTLHMDMWGPAHVSGQSRERYFVLVVDDYTRYTTVFPLRSKGQVVDVLIPWICTVRLQLREQFGQDLPVLRLHSDRGAPHWLSHVGRSYLHDPCSCSPFSVTVCGPVHCASAQPLAPCLLTGDLAHTALDGGGWRCVGVLGRAFIRDTSADKLSARAIPFVFLGFVPGTPGWQFYHPTLRHVLPSQDVTFDESVPFYRLFFYRSALPPPPSLFLAPGPPPVGPLPPQGPAPSGVSQVDPLPGTGPVEIAVSSGAAPGGASGVVASGGAEPGGAGSEGDGSRGAEPEGVEPGDADSEGAESGGAEPRGAASSGGPAGASPRLSPQQLREWLVRRARLRSGAPGAGGAGDAGAGGAGVTARAGGAGGTTTASPGGARTRGTGVGGAGVGGTGAGGAGAAGARAGGAGGTVRPRLSAVLQSVVSLRLVLSRLFALLVALLVSVLLLSPARMLWHSVLPPFHCVFLCLILLSLLFLRAACTRRSGCAAHLASLGRFLQVPSGASGGQSTVSARRLASGTTLAALGFAPATADPSLFLRTDTLLPPFYVLVYINDLVFATANTEALTLVKSFSASTSCSPRHSPLLCLPATRSELHLRTSPTSGMGLVLGGRGLVVLTGHADVSWVDDSATQRSSQGYTFSLGSGSVSWRSTRSSSVLSSRYEVEIYAGAMAAQELCWLTYLLTDLGEQPRLPPVLYVDNKAMIALCQKHRLEHRTKHIALRYFLARELQQRGQLFLAYVATRANTADIFTKALPPSDHQRFSTVLGLVPTVPHLLTA